MTPLCRPASQKMSKRFFFFFPSSFLSFFLSCIVCSCQFVISANQSYTFMQMRYSPIFTTARSFLLQHVAPSLSLSLSLSRPPFSLQNENLRLFIPFFFLLLFFSFLLLLLSLSLSPSLHQRKQGDVDTRLVEWWESFLDGILPLPS